MSVASDGIAQWWDLSICDLSSVIQAFAAQLQGTYARDPRRQVQALLKIGVLGGVYLGVYGRSLTPLDGHSFGMMGLVSWRCVTACIFQRQKRLAGVPGRARTCDPQLRRLLLCPAELRGRREAVSWSGREDSNLRPPAPKAGALPDCATPRRGYSQQERTEPDSVRPLWLFPHSCGVAGGLPSTWRRRRGRG